MKVLSLFDGVSCGRLALERAGIPVEAYYSSEIDKYCMTITERNYPDTRQIGGVEGINVRQNIVPYLTYSSFYGDITIRTSIDLLIGGPPCQGFSFAGKQLNFKDPRSALIFHYFRIFKELKPKYFLLENVKMKREYQDAISEILGVTPVEINSALVSAQNRKRLYWTNIPNITQPEDTHTYLYDIIEDGMTDRDKSHCIDANYFKGGNLKSYFEKHRRQLIFSRDELCHIGDADFKGFDSMKRVYHPAGKAPTLTSMGGGHREPKILCGAWRGRYVIEGVRQDSKMLTAGKTKQRMEVRPDGKTNALTTVQKDNNILYLDELRWRKLTPLECERLQTLPDGYTEILAINRYFLYIKQETNYTERIKNCNKHVQHIGVNGVQQLINLEHSVYYITKEFIDMETQNCLIEYSKQKKSVGIVIELLVKKVAEQEECVVDTTKVGIGIKTLYTQIKENLHWDQEATRKELVVRINTDKYLKIILKENYNQLNEYITLIFVKLIIELKIYTYVKHRANIHFSIDNLSVWQENSFRMELSNFLMDNIILCSNTQRYKAIGNGWTVDVLAHIFRGLNND